jgi:transcriptional regulator
MPEPAEIVRGTLDLLILRAVSWGPVHGYSVARWIAQATSDTLNIEEGTLYPALHRLHERGLIAAEWGLSENNRRARYYRLTPEGRRQLRNEESVWRRYAEAVFKVLEPA